MKKREGEFIVSVCPTCRCALPNTKPCCQKALKNSIRGEKAAATREHNQYRTYNQQLKDGFDLIQENDGEP